MINPTSSPELSHFPVMPDEVIKICSPKQNCTYIDCTFGGGNYTKKLLKFSQTKVIALDRDEFILGISTKLKKEYPTRFNFHQKKFSEIDKIIKNQLVEGVLFDLGLSSIQLKNLKRGFSFKSKDKLDMSMGLSSYSAEKVVNNSSEQALKLIIKVLGEEEEASKIAKNIVKFRSVTKITKVNQLVDIIKQSKKKNYKKKIDPSTKTFQALRIFVNKEITELIKGIVNATKILKPGGKILIVSFHSIEDKIVKFFFNNYSTNKSNPSRYLPESKGTKKSLFTYYRNKVYRPSKLEVDKNPASRSAKLRYAIRNDSKFIYPDALIDKFRFYLDVEDMHV